MPKKQKAPKGPKILLFDIETAPMRAFLWSLWKVNYVPLIMVESDWYMLSFAAKWLGSKELIYHDQRKVRNIENDAALCKKLWHLLDEADIVITQNGKAFDSKKANARFILNGLQPPSTYKHIDTKQIAKKHFGFPSNSLEYLTDKLCVKYKKLKHKKFPGFSLWTGCMDGNIKAWKEMETYNKHDVLSLEEVYKKLQPWDNTVDFNLYYEDSAIRCSCGSQDFHKNGWKYMSQGKYQRYKCLECGSETRSRTNVFSKEKRQSLRGK